MRAYIMIAAFAAIAMIAVAHTASTEDRVIGAPDCTVDCSRQAADAVRHEQVCPLTQITMTTAPITQAARAERVSRFAAAAVSDVGYFPPYTPPPHHPSQLTAMIRARCGDRGCDRRSIENCATMRRRRPNRGRRPGLVAKVFTDSTSVSA